MSRPKPLEPITYPDGRPIALGDPVNFTASGGDLIACNGTVIELRVSLRGVPKIVRERVIVDVGGNTVDAHPSELAYDPPDMTVTIPGGMFHLLQDVNPGLPSMHDQNVAYDLVAHVIDNAKPHTEWPDGEPEA